MRPDNPELMPEDLFCGAINSTRDEIRVRLHGSFLVTKRRLDTELKMSVDVARELHEILSVLLDTVDGR